MAQERTKKDGKNNKKIYWIIGILVVLIVVLIIGRKQGWIGKSKVVEVEFGKAITGDIVEKVAASGTVQPVVEVKIAPEVSGEIIELNVEDGDSVTIGRSLVKIRPDAWLSQLERSEATLNQQRANVSSAESGLSRARATFIRAEADYKRQERLWNEKVISEADWQLARQNYEVSKTDLASAQQSLEASGFIVKSTEAAVKEARENVRKTLVVAPMNGIVSKLNVKRGERVVGTIQMQGTEMLRIADLNAMEVRVNVNENDIVRVHLNDTVLIDVDSYANQNKQFKGLVTNIANTAKEKLSADAITEFEVRILVLRTSYEDLIRKGIRYPFRPGMTASVEILTNRKSKILMVPLAAVTTRNPEADGLEDEEKEGEAGNTSNRADDKKQDLSKKKAEKIVVFVKDGDVARMKEVKTGISDYDNIEILSGIKEGAEIVTGPFLVVSKRLKDGDQVKLKEKEKEDKEKKD
jgi:HlyD family secretion protein